MFKKFTKLIAGACFALMTMQANATLVTQDIYLEVFDSTTNAFGIDAGFDGIIGTIQYNHVPVDDFGETNAALDRFFNFEITLGSYSFSMFDDIDFPDFPLAYIDPTDLFGGVMGLDTVLEDFDFNMVDIFSAGANGFASIFASDDNGGFFEGEISFINTAVPEPSILALFMVSLFGLRRKFMS